MTDDRLFNLTQLTLGVDNEQEAIAILDANLGEDERKLVDRIMSEWHKQKQTPYGQMMARDITGE